MAAKVPRWMLDWGLVQFYGQDLDYTCYLMARANMRLYGLNGDGIRYAIILNGIESIKEEQTAYDYAIR